MVGVYIFSLVFGCLVILIDLFGLLGSNESEPSGDMDGTDLSGDDQGITMPDSGSHRWVYQALNILRLCVYFCCGFGAVGVFGTYTNQSFLLTFLCSFCTGLVIMGIVKLISHIQNSMVDSQLKNGDLLFAEGEVLVTIYPGKIGKVRITVGGSYHDLFAVGKESGSKYEVGDKIFVVDTSSKELVIDSGRSERFDLGRDRG